MKTTIAIFVALLFTAASLPAKATDINVPWEKKHQTTIEKDSSGGYTQEQTDYKARKKRSEDIKSGEAYYNGNYHAKGKDFRPNELQFVEPGDNVKSSKSHKSGAHKTKASSNKQIKKTETK